MFAQRVLQKGSEDVFVGIARRKLFPIMVVLILLAGVLAGCAPAAQPPQPDGLTRIVVADAPTTHHLNLYVAQEKGLFAKYGLEVEIISVESLSAARDAVVTGAADVFWSCPTVAIAAIAGGAPIRTIAQVKTPCTSVLLVPGDSPIQDYQDLAGKTIAGISPSCEAVIAISNAARKAGVEFNLVTLAGGAAIAALEAGQIDGAILEEPHASIAELAGFRVLFREAAEAIPCRTINARTAFITDNADALRSMIRALDEANAIINADPVADDIVAIAVVPTGAPREAIIHGNPRLIFTTRLDEEGLCRLGDELVELGHIEECPSDYMYAPEFRGITWD
ncbi:MAG TPA: ABC transporter substrate-binding protein [Candidatus Limnocylindrales bacterium]|nr:ABC transporter substrate-binding protein [Candidatus Limnocylindrales bacterium]